MDRFIFCANFIKKQEGGFNYISGDTGGMTIFGIARNFNKKCKFWQRIDSLLPGSYKLQDIYESSAISKTITNTIKQDKSAMKEIDDIYYSYWSRCRAYSLPEPLDLIHFDTFFNMGTTANKLLQKWAGVEQDGILGPISMSAIKQCTRPPKDLLLLRWEYYKSRKNFNKFCNGWKKRLNHLAKSCNISITF